MKWMMLVLAMWLWCAAGCAWLRPPEGARSASSTNSPAVVSPVSGASGEARSTDPSRR